MSNLITPSNYKKLNFFISLTYLAQAFLIFFLSKTLIVPIVNNFLLPEASASGYIHQIRADVEISIPLLLIITLGVSVVVHLLISFFYNNKLNENNPIKNIIKIDQSISAGLVILVLSLLMDVYDAISLLIIFGTTILMGLISLIIKNHWQKLKKFKTIFYWIGCFTGIIPWLMMLIFFYIFSDNTCIPPKYIFWIIISVFVFFIGFISNNLLQYKKIGKWKNDLYGEFIYVLLNTTLKTAVVWQIFAGALQS